jgi:hypothetical protein
VPSQASSRAKASAATFSATPTEGDCVTKPVTRVKVHADFYFASSFFKR